MPKQVVRHVLSKQHMVLSDYIIEEFVDYCKSVHPSVPRKWLRRLRQKLEAYSYDDAVDMNDAVRDINDTDILKLAIKQKAVIVTGDKDLLEHKPQSRVAIVSTVEYSQLFELLYNETAG
jgi:predicted nucleic acid-binding protein